MTTPSAWAETKAPGSWVLLSGDLAAFMVFAALGRTSHHEVSGLWAVVVTAAPFAAGWLAVAPLLGAFSAGRWTGPRELLLRTALAWLCAWPVGLLLRATVQQRGIPLSFDLVALLANAVLLLGWRASLLYMCWVRP